MLSLQQLQFHYHKKRPLFTGLNLEITQGGIYGLLGRNGAGKTTLLKLIAGLRFPKEGSCRFLEEDSGKRLPSVLQEMFFLPEEFYAPAMSANVFAKRYAGFYPRFDHELFQHNLKEFGLDPDVKLTSQSYGQKKKALLSFAMATNCKLLLLDEPTNGLDIPSKSKFRKLLASSFNEEQVYLISTHQVRDLGNMLDPVIILDAGKIIFHQNMMNIAGKLHFEVVSNIQEDEDIIHSERVPGGYMVVSPNLNGFESEPEMEILFNTVIANPEKVQSIFQTPETHEAN